MQITCCKDCVAPKRYPGCHAKCAEYIKQKEARERYLESIRRKKFEDSLSSHAKTPVQYKYKY